MAIKSVVDEREGKSTGDMDDDDATCSICEKAVIWMQNQLRQNQTMDDILNNVNLVRQICISQLFKKLI